MTDKIEALREKAEKASEDQWGNKKAHYTTYGLRNFHEVATPPVVLSLLSELDRLRSSNEAMRKALEGADAAIVYYLRYLNGGEMRGSYDGKPEWDALRRASYATRAALSSLQEEEAQ